MKISKNIKQNRAITPPIVLRILAKNLLSQIEFELSSESLENKPLSALDVDAVFL